MTTAWNRFWYAPAPLGRVAIFRIIVYLYVPFDLLIGVWVADHGIVPDSWYAPLWIGRLLHIPGPSGPGMAIAGLALVGLSLVAASGRGRRFVGPAVLLLYFYWWYIGFSYGKVDHDKLALLVALAVVPTVPWTNLKDATMDTRAGWVLRAVQVAVVLVYLLSGITKLRVSGLGWMTSSILVFAIVRRGTMFADPLLDYPPLLYAMQAGIMAFELFSPLMLFRSKIARIYVLAAFGFHLVSYVGITIHFLPQVICLFAFLPLEKGFARLSTLRWKIGIGRRAVSARAV
jgi:hypothetical protein